MARSILFQTNDSVIFKVQIQVAAVSDLLKETIGLFGVNNNDDEIIPLNTMNSQVFARALAWMIRHQDKPRIEKPPKRSRNTEFSDTLNIPHWDLQFFESIPRDELVALAEAADFLRIEYLQDLISKYLSNFARHIIKTKQLRVEKANTVVETVSGNSRASSSNDHQQSSRDDEQSTDNCNDDQTNIPKDCESSYMRLTFPLTCRNCRVCRLDPK